MWGHLAAIVEASPLTAAQRLDVWQSRFDGLRRIGDGLAPFRLSGDELHLFSDLVEAAAVERALGDGVMPWDDDGSDAGELVPLFPDGGEQR